MPHLDPSLCKKLESHFNKAAEAHEKTNPRSNYRELFRMVMEANKEPHAASAAKLVVPFSYMEINFSRAMNEANQIVRDHKGPKA